MPDKSQSPDMIWLFVMLSVVLLFALYLFCAPFYIEIDTVNEMYRVRLHRIASLRLVVTEGSPYLQGRIAWWIKNIFFDTGRTTKTAVAVKEPRTSAANKKQKQRNTISGKKLVQVLRSFRITQCRIRLNTGSMPLNGMLYPMFYWMNRYTQHEVAISFTGETEVQLVVKNSLARMAWAYMKKH